MCIAASLLLVTAACGGGSAGSGPVDVLYAGSLLPVMEHRVDPAFHAATGYTVSGVSGDSGALANQVKGGTLQGDVYLSAGAAKDQALEGPANGGWVTWYATFASSDLVLGYDPKSRFAAALRRQPWYDVITRPGFLLGRTDPATDPKGQLTVTALQDAAAAGHGGTAALLASAAGVFPEDTLVGRLQSGQLDAGFFYSVEAASAGIPTVPLTGIPTLAARYTLTVLDRAAHEQGAERFVRYLLSPAGRQVLTAAGLTVAPRPEVSGTPPAGLRSLFATG